MGPVTANFDTAFTFTHFETSRQGNRRRRAAAAADDSSNNDPAKNENLEDEAKPLNLDLGQSSAVWSRAEDFWHAVGWAFNCSVLHARRWERWRLWLEFMCEVLEDDWNERMRRVEHEERDIEGGNGGSTSKQKKRRQRALQESLVFRYIEGESVGLGRNRRILRAIFADGSGGSVNEFREVFHNELKELKRDQGNNVKKREAEVNIDEEQYGDYLTRDDDEEEEEEADNTSNAKANDNNDTTERPRRPKRTRRGTRNTEQSTSTTTTTQTTAAANNFSIHGGLSLLGGLPSLALRQRLLHLLSVVSESLPQSFIPLEELYHLFVENIRHLPLPIYQAFLSPSALPYFSAAAQTTLCECLLFRLRESGAPDTDEEYLNQTKLEQCFLPYAAGNAGVVDNVRMSIALEALLVLLAESGLLAVTGDLKEAVQEGILARVERAQDEVRRNQIRRHTEDIEWCWLIESGERILFLVNDLLPQADGSGDGDWDCDGQG